MKTTALALHQAETQSVLSARLGAESHQQRRRARLRPGDRLESVALETSTSYSRPAEGQSDPDRFVSPRAEGIVAATGLPLVEAVGPGGTARSSGAGPCCRRWRSTARRVRPGAEDAASSSWTAPPPSPSLQLGMMTEQEITAPPVPGPAHRRQELVGPVRLPVGEQQLRLRGQGVDHLAAQDAVLAVARLQVAVQPEGLGRHLAGRACPAVPIAAEPGVEDRDLDALAASARGRASGPPPAGSGGHGEDPPSTTQELASSVAGLGAAACTCAAETASTARVTKREIGAMGRVRVHGGGGSRG